MMRRWTIGLLAVLLGFAPSAPTIVGATPEQTATIREVLNTFETAGLTLPADLTFRTSTTCRPQQHGYYNHASTTITLCTDSARIIAHETAHAWTAAHLTEADQAAFLALNPYLTSWNGSDSPWSRRGIELAAETIVWGLDTTPVGTAGSTWNERFKALTGFDAERFQPSR